MLRFALLVATLSAVAAPASEPTQMRLTIGENAYNVPVGKAFAVRIGSDRVTVRIDPLTEQAFNAAGVSFRYPAGLQAAESPAGDGARVWTLQGQSTAVMLQQYGSELDPKSLRQVLVENLIEGFDQTVGDGVEKPKTVRLTTPGRAYDGVQLNYTTPAEGAAPATQTVQNVFTFANAQGVFALMVQDVRPQGAEDSTEYAETLRLLGESLKTGDEPPAAAGAAANRNEAK